MPAKRLRLVYFGQFDRVDFRDQAERFAAIRGITGYARKISDDRIEVVAEGEERELQSFLQDLNEYMDLFIERYKRDWLTASGEYDRFRFMNF